MDVNPKYYHISTMNEIILEMIDEERICEDIMDYDLLRSIRDTDRNISNTDTIKRLLEGNKPLYEELVNTINETTALPEEFKIKYIKKLKKYYRCNKLVKVKVTRLK